MSYRPDSDAALALLGIAAMLCVFAAAWFLEDRINDLLQIPGAWFKGDANPALALIGAAAVIAANLLWLPGAMVGAWVLLAAAVACALAAAYVRISARASRKRRR